MTAENVYNLTVKMFGPEAEPEFENKELKIRTIEITPEDNGWIVNGLAIRPGRIVIPSGMSERTREELARNRIEIVELPYHEMHHNGGGIHCSTCPLIRDRVD